jgi:hypothetical protein
VAVDLVQVAGWVIVALVRNYFKRVSAQVSFSGGLMIEEILKDPTNAELLAKVTRLAEKLELPLSKFPGVSECHLRDFPMADLAGYLAVAELGGSAPDVREIRGYLGNRQLAFSGGGAEWIIDLDLTLAIDLDSDYLGSMGLEELGSQLSISLSRVEESKTEDHWLLSNFINLRQSNFSDLEEVDFDALASRAFEALRLESLILGGEPNFKPIFSTSTFDEFNQNDTSSSARLIRRGEAIPQEMLSSFLPAQSDFVLAEAVCSEMFAKSNFQYHTRDLTLRQLRSSSSTIAEYIWKKHHESRFLAMFEKYSFPAEDPGREDQRRWMFIALFSALFTVPLVITLPIYWYKRHRAEQLFRPAIVPHELKEIRLKFLSSLSESADQKFAQLCSKYVDKAFGSRPEDWAASVGNKWRPLAPRPTFEVLALTPKEAEETLAEYMKFLGASGVKVTRYSRDGGIDIYSDKYVAQVKHQEAPVGVRALRELIGVASLELKTPLFFAKRGYTSDALRFGTGQVILLFSYEKGDLSPHNQSATQALSYGL